MGSTITDYADNYVYENGSLQFFNHTEGYVTPNGSTYDYVYQFKDHLDNVRLSYSDNDNNGTISQSEIIEESNYYPFGFLQKGYNTNVSSSGNSTAQKFKYNGKELEEDLNLDVYDYGARRYMPDLGRWMSIDNRAELYIGHSTYHYSANNPIYFKDVDGNYYVGIDGKAVTTSVTKDGSIKLSSNASTDLKRKASLINASGSKTAVSQFNKVGNNETKVHFKISQNLSKIDEDGNVNLGVHQAHDADGNALEWNSKTGKFEGEVAFKTDSEGNLIYEEATITLYEKVISILAGDENKDTEMVAINAHEDEHDLNKKDIKSIKDRANGKSNKRDVEKKASKVERKVRRQIRKHKKDK